MTENVASSVEAVMPCESTAGETTLPPSQVAGFSRKIEHRPNRKLNTAAPIEPIRMARLPPILSASGPFEREKLPPVMVGATPERKNVVARLRGTGKKPPLLLSAHLDVVPAEPESWRHPPFCGEIHDGYLWGRGAIDMKHMAVMSALVVARLAREKLPLKRDVIFAGVADEEAGCDFGSKFLVDHHADLVKAEFALGEAGAFTVHIGG